DVAQVSDGFAPQTNIVRQDGRRGTLLTIMKTGTASTLDVVQGIRDMLPRVAMTLPSALHIQPLADQAVFVRAAVSGVIREAIIAACLRGVMILLFLGSWRSTLIIAISIPLSILTSIMVLSFLGQTINIMTLGGLALAVGILVDDATVEIENTNRNLEQGKALKVVSFAKERLLHHGNALEATVEAGFTRFRPVLMTALAMIIGMIPMALGLGEGGEQNAPLGRAVIGGLLCAPLAAPLFVPPGFRLAPGLRAGCGVSSPGRGPRAG